MDLPPAAATSEMPASVSTDRRAASRTWARAGGRGQRACVPVWAGDWPSSRRAARELAGRLCHARCRRRRLIGAGRRCTHGCTQPPPWLRPARTVSCSTRWISSTNLCTKGLVCFIASCTSCLMPFSGDTRCGR